MKIGCGHNGYLLWLSCSYLWDNFIVLKVFKAVLQFHFKFQQPAKLKLVGFFTHVWQKNSLSTRSIIESWVLLGLLVCEKSAVFSCTGCSWENGLLKRLPAKRSGGMFSMETICLYLYGCGWSFLMNTVEKRAARLPRSIRLSMHIPKGGCGPQDSDFRFIWVAGWHEWGRESRKRKPPRCERRCYKPSRNRQSRRGRPASLHSGQGGKSVQQIGGRNNLLKSIVLNNNNASFNKERMIREKIVMGPGIAFQKEKWSLNPYE